MSGKNAKLMRKAARLMEQERANQRVEIERERDHPSLVHFQHTVTNTRVQLAIPPAEELAKYDQIQQGLAQRIIGMAATAE